MRNKKLGVGIIGFGVSGKYFHAPFIHCSPELELKAVVSTRREEIHFIYPYVQVWDDPDRLFKDSEIELVIVATPNTSHFELGKRALEHGKHVIIEKPFAPTSGEARELTAIAKEKNLVLSVYHNRRWDGDFLTVKKILKEGLLGRVIEFESSFDRYRPISDSEKWRNMNIPGSGLLFDIGSHLIDQAVCLFGKPCSVRADIRTVEEACLVDDCFEVRLQYEGLDVTLKASNFVPEPGPRFISKGARGSFIKYGLDPQEKMLRQGIMPDTSGWGREDEGMCGILNTEINGSHSRAAVETIAGNYAGYFTNVYGAITNNEAPAVRPEDAVLVIEIIERAFESSRQRRCLEL
jgi:scyllo-inositol 2-dehydrogenase (NADP+)